MLDPVTSFELIGGPTYHASPIQGDIFAQTTGVEEISRTIPSLWQIRVPEEISPGSILVNYKLKADNGKANRLSHTSLPKAEIRVNIQPLSPHIIEQEEYIIEEIVHEELESDEEAQEDKTDNEISDVEETTDIEVPESTRQVTPPSPAKRVVRKILRINVIEGGVSLSFDPSQIQYAGTYSGTLRIMIHGL